MQYQAKSLLLILFFQCSSAGFSGRHNSHATNGDAFSRDAKDSHGFSLGRGLDLLRLGKRGILSSLDFEGDSVLEKIRSSIHSLEEPGISESHHQTVRDTRENKESDVNDGINIEVLGDWPRDTDFNYISSRNNKQFSKRQLPMFRWGKRSVNQDSLDAEDKIKLYMNHEGVGYFQGIDERESDDDNVSLTNYSEDEEEQPDLSMLRLGKRQLPMLRLGKRQLPMLRLGKRQLPMLRLGKRQLPMLRLGKRQLPMLRLGKRQLPMLRLGKRKHDRYREPEEPSLERLRFETPELEFVK